jgi:hypothetical protein
MNTDTRFALFFICLMVFNASFNNISTISNCVLISSKFERGRSLIRNFAIKTKDGNKRYQRKKERIVKVSRYQLSFAIITYTTKPYIISHIRFMNIYIYVFVITTQ